MLPWALGRLGEGAPGVCRAQRCSVRHWGRSQPLSTEPKLWLGPACSGWNHATSTSGRAGLHGSSCLGARGRQGPRQGTCYAGEDADASVHHPNRPPRTLPPTPVRGEGLRALVLVGAGGAGLCRVA